MYVGLYIAGKLSGSISTRRTDIVLYNAVNKVEVKFESVDSMFNFFYSKYENLQQFTDLLFVYGIDDNTMCLFDRRTADFFDAYNFYKNSPEKAYSEVYFFWYKVYSLINKIMNNNAMRSFQWL